MKIKFNIIISCTLIIIFTIIVCGCQKSKTPLLNDGSSINSPVNDIEFGEIFVSFTELKDVSMELLKRKPDANWWTSFDSVNNHSDAIINQNNLIYNYDGLSDIDKQLSLDLKNILNIYSDAFDIMQASRNSYDQEILNYAYNEFSTKINSANDMWEFALSDALSTPNNLQD